MTSEQIDLLQGHILLKVQMRQGCGDYTRYDIFLNHKTLRLRKPGMKILCKMYNHYKFKSNKIPSNALLKLFKKAKTPYYLGKDAIVLYSEQDAFIFKLGGFDAWTEF